MKGHADSVSQPFGFRNYLKSQPKPGFDFIPFLDLVIVFVVLGLNFSDFLFVPGARVELPKSGMLSSPVSQSMAVLTVGKNELYFFEGFKISPSALQESLETFISGVDGDHESILLLKADQELTSDVLFKLFESAREAGFSQVQIAAEMDQQLDLDFGNR